MTPKSLLLEELLQEDEVIQKEALPSLDGKSLCDLAARTTHDEVARLALLSLLEKGEGVYLIASNHAHLKRRFPERIPMVDALIFEKLITNFTAMESGVIAHSLSLLSEESVEQVVMRAPLLAVSALIDLNDEERLIRVVLTHENPQIVRLAIQKIGRLPSLDKLFSHLAKGAVALPSLPEKEVESLKEEVAQKIAHQRARKSTFNLLHLVRLGELIQNLKAIHPDLHSEADIDRLEAEGRSLVPLHDREGLMRLSDALVDARLRLRSKFSAQVHLNNMELMLERLARKSLRQDGSYPIPTGEHPIISLSEEEVEALLLKEQANEVATAAQQTNTAAQEATTTPSAQVIPQEETAPIEEETLEEAPKEVLEEVFGEIPEEEVPKEVLEEEALEKTLGEEETLEEAPKEVLEEVFGGIPEEEAPVEEIPEEKAFGETLEEEVFGETLEEEVLAEASEEAPSTATNETATTQTAASEKESEPRKKEPVGLSLAAITAAIARGDYVAESLEGTRKCAKQLAVEIAIAQQASHDPRLLQDAEGYLEFLGQVMESWNELSSTTAWFVGLNKEKIGSVSLMEVCRRELAAERFLVRFEKDFAEGLPLFRRLKDAYQAYQQQYLPLVRHRQFRLAQYLYQRLDEIRALLPLREFSRMLKQLKRTDNKLAVLSPKVRLPLMSLRDSLIAEVKDAEKSYTKWLQPVQNRLCEEMSTLVTLEVSAPELKARLAALQAEWKHHSFGVAHQPHWFAFQQHARAVFARYQTMNEAFLKERKESAGARAALFEKVEKFLKEYDWDAPVWRDVALFCTNSWKEWRAIKGGTKSEKLRFQDIMSQLQSHLSAHYTQMAVEKETLIAEVSALLEQKDPRSRAKTKEIQAKWKEISHAGSHESDLWARFSSLCQQVFTFKTHGSEHRFDVLLNQWNAAMENGGPTDAIEAELTAFDKTTWSEAERERFETRLQRLKAKQHRLFRKDDIPQADGERRSEWGGARGKGARGQDRGHGRGRDGSAPFKREHTKKPIFDIQPLLKLLDAELQSSTKAEQLWESMPKAVPHDLTPLWKVRLSEKALVLDKTLLHELAVCMEILMGRQSPVADTVIRRTQQIVLLAQGRKYIDSEETKRAYFLEAAHDVLCAPVRDEAAHALMVRLLRVVTSLL